VLSGEKPAFCGGPFREQKGRLATFRGHLLEDWIMEQPGLHGRHRDKGGEIGRKHGNTKVRTLRQVYGRSFAAGSNDDMELKDVLLTMDEPSLNQLIHDHERGELDKKLAPPASS
jgi:hypothetical protein